MKITRLYMGNSLRNYCHLIACEETGETIVLDPLDADKCLSEAQRQNLTITKIVNTHEHYDHIQGNPEIVAATGAKIHAHMTAMATIPNASVPLLAGQAVEAGTTVKLHVLHTPGHTRAHVCLLSEIGAPSLFSGDTLFNAGSGNCKFGGDPHDMYRTFVDQLALLPDETCVYPGHDYIINNLSFALSVEPDNDLAKRMLGDLETQSPHKRQMTTMAMEKQINPFFRSESPSIKTTLKAQFPDMNDDPETVFVTLRRLRDDW
ncbi:Hydroxyacylglutathione hydrolase [Pseudovibrio axinellae]|uniref:Hydroxyacylglutathione hydrolase n=1 Tax=Pseudovibrio axinellae TaxID=989403 RepID=A0A165YBL0_9HYPH|nr:hydroxyacylglutathione hydrolase [Pseudovibrio axinellae]KZL18642.1 Hydroxyacylglutathione hydrolase [Pseudovibrio axinellae]SER73586.1 hydroxyacylglutathione hydrolase [Pseudovibrio axinellae]